MRSSRPSGCAQCSIATSTNASTTGSSAFTNSDTSSGVPGARPTRPSTIRGRPPPGRREELRRFIYVPAVTGQKSALGLAHRSSEPGRDVKRSIGGAQPRIAIKCGDVGFDDENMARLGWRHE